MIFENVYESFSKLEKDYVFSLKRIMAFPTQGPYFLSKLVLNV